MGGFFLISGALSPGWIVERILPWPVTAALILPLAALTSWYLVSHAGRSENDVVKVDFVLGMTLVFVPIDIIGELGGDVGVLLFTGLILAMLILLRQRARHFRQTNLPSGLIKSGRSIPGGGAMNPSMTELSFIVSAFGNQQSRLSSRS